MSFLTELKKQMNKLKQTETVVTDIEGHRHIERGNILETLTPNTYGFIVDTAPDNTPVLIMNFLYIGSQDCAVEDILRKYDIKNVLSLGININFTNINHKFVECYDLPETNIRPVLDESLPFIKEAVSLRQNVLVHCNAGVSRTSMVAIAYLMHFKSMSFEVAYDLVKDKRPAIQPNTGFVRQLKLLVPGQVVNI